MLSYSRNWEVGSLGVGAGLYMYDGIVKSSRSLSISSPYEFLLTSAKRQEHRCRTCWTDVPRGVMGNTPFISLCMSHYPLRHVGLATPNIQGGSKNRYHCVWLLTFSKHLNQFAWFWH